MVITLKLVFPFKQARRFCYRGLSLCLATNAAMSKAAASWLNNALKTELFSPPGLVFSAAKWKLCLAFPFQSAIFVERNWVPSYYNHWSPHKVPPIRVDRLLKEVSTHRDQHLVEYLLAGIYNGVLFWLQPSFSFLEINSAEWALSQSSSIGSVLVSIYVQNEPAKEWIAGSFSTPPVTQSSC